MAHTKRRGSAPRGGSPREGVRSELASAATTGGGGPARLPRPVHRPCERSNDWRRGAASSPDPKLLKSAAASSSDPELVCSPRPKPSSGKCFQKVAHRGIE